MQSWGGSLGRERTCRREERRKWWLEAKTQTGSSRWLVEAEII
jgi:hypothetical protein